MSTNLIPAPLSRSEHPLARARLAAGLSQERLAAAAGVDQASVSRVECGWQPPRRIAERVAGALGLHPDDLEGWR